MTRDEFLRPADVEQDYGISPSTLGNWRTQGTGPEWQYLGPRRIVYRRSSVEAWIEQQRQRAAS